MLSQTILISCFILLAVFSAFSQGYQREKREFFPIRVNNQGGFIDRTGKVVIEPQFDQISDFTGGIARVWINCAPRPNMITAVPCERRFIDKSGNFVRNPILDEGHQIEFSEGVAAVRIGSLETGKYGFIDNKGTIVIAAQFAYAIRFSEDLARVLDGGKYGFIDHSGKFVIPLQYENAGDFSESLAAVQSGEKYGFIDKSGKLVIEPQFVMVKDFGDGLAPVRIGDRWGFIDRQGKIAIKPQYQYVWEFNDGLAAIYENEKWGFIDTTGKIVIAPRFDYVGDVSDDRILVKIKGKYGYIDKKGRMMIKPQFLGANGFNGGLAYVSGDASGYIDTNGKFVWTPPTSISPPE